MAPAPLDGPHPLVLPCVGELCRQTRDLLPGTTPPQAVQACGDACPGCLRADHPAPPRQVFTLLADGSLDADAHVWVACTPEGRALFHAWLRRRGVDPGRGSASDEGQVSGVRNPARSLSHRACMRSRVHIRRAVACRVARAYASGVCLPHHEPARIKPRYRVCKRLLLPARRST